MAWNFKSNKEREEYHKENPHAASHPYAKGKKLKPKGVDKTKVAKKMTHYEGIKDVKKHLAKYKGDKNNTTVKMLKEQGY